MQLSTKLTMPKLGLYNMTLNNTVEGMRQKRRAEQKSIFTTTIQTSPYGHFGFPGVLNMMVIV